VTSSIFIASHLDVSDAFPLAFHEPAVTVREIGRVTIAARTEGDFPEVNVIVTLHTAVTAE
jgi:hypothetical protein